MLMSPSRSVSTNHIRPRYIVADPEICHGQLTFKGTRIMVRQVLEQLARGMSWEEIIDEWRGAISSEAIAEALRIASDTLLNHPVASKLEAAPA